jgi:hypothetical protein
MSVWVISIYVSKFVFQEKFDKISFIIRVTEKG